MALSVIAGVVLIGTAFIVDTVPGGPGAPQVAGIAFVVAGCAFIVLGMMIRHGGVSSALAKGSLAVVHL